MSNVNAYYTGPAMPQPTAAPGQPTPVTVNVNAPRAYTGTPGAQPTYNIDSYVGTAATVANAAAPYAPGAVAGVKAARGMATAKYEFAKASRSRSMRTKATAGQAGRSAMLSGIGKAVKSSVLFNGIISLATNGYKIYKGEQTTAVGGANVVGDVASAAVGGAAGAAASAAGTALLAGILGTGLPLTLAGIGLGIGGYLLADTFFRNTPFFQKLKQGTHDMIAKVTG